MSDPLRRESEAGRRGKQDKQGEVARDRQGAIYRLLDEAKPQPKEK
jgi:hypothetical protein